MFVNMAIAISFQSKFKKKTLGKRKRCCCNTI